MAGLRTRHGLAQTRNQLIWFGDSKSLWGARFTNVQTEGGVNAETGFGRIIMELGGIGFLLIAWLLLAMANFMRKVILYMAQSRHGFSTWCLGLTAILIATLAHFFVAGQVFGDPFILIILGLVAGFILSGPMQVLRNRLARQGSVAPVTA